MTLVEWFNNNDGFAMALLTAVYVLATLAIVIESRRTSRLQKRLLEQSEAAERSRKRPYVIFSIDFERIQGRNESSTYVYATVRNVGVTSAHDVVVTTTPDLKGRLGIDSKMRHPATVGSVIAFMPPNYELKDLVAYAPFLFQDNKDEELRFQIGVAYKDSVGETYSEQYVIDVAAQKESSDIERAEALIGLKLVEQAGRISRSLENIARTLDRPDRSLFAGSLVASNRVSAEQKSLLAQLISAVGESRSSLFLVNQYVGDDQATIRLVRDDESNGSGSNKIKGYIEDLEYLCRVGALHGHYRGGSLQFSLTPLATVTPWRVNGTEDAAQTIEPEAQATGE
jgi:hypothetical protein